MASREKKMRRVDMVVSERYCATGRAGGAGLFDGWQDTGAIDQGCIMLKSRAKPTRCWPPSTTIVVPVMAELVAANTTASATFFGSLARPSGAMAWVRAKASVDCMWLGRVRPGATPTTLTEGASDCASMVLAASRAALLSV